ncbi:MAG: hypothetical protein H8E45_12410, partial [Proteobacteria bacterium]|nr:hypothetical protein [Pseudomonadota bacterium]
GEVSSFDWRTRRITDPAWDSGIGWLVEKSGAPVVPAYISGRNSCHFLAAVSEGLARAARELEVNCLVTGVSGRSLPYRVFRGQVLKKLPKLLPASCRLMVCD